MDAHICQSCGHLWAAHTMYSDTNLCRSPGCCCERSQLNAEKHNNQDATARIAALEAQLAAEREAVRVLGEFAYWQDGDNAVRHLTSDKKLDYVNKIIYKTWSAIYANPIASAAIKAATDAGKAREP